MSLSFFRTKNKNKQTLKIKIFLEKYTFQSSFMKQWPQNGEKQNNKLMFYKYFINLFLKFH